MPTQPQQKQQTWNQCRSCNRETHHDIEGQYLYETDPSGYHYRDVHYIVKCRGCDCVSFKKVEMDLEAAYPTADGEWDIPQTTSLYPKAAIGKMLPWDMPDIVASIYNETCQAYSEGSWTLAGIGFRATIEAICKDLSISGKELSVRINNLASKGLISKKDSSRLHSIRFLGNDAAHDIKKPSEESLRAALIIVEHLITTVYVLDTESEGKLEALIEDYSKFEKLLNEKLKNIDPNTEGPLQLFLGKETRLISGSTAAITKELNSRIGQGLYKKLSFGKKAKYQGSTEPLQHYIVTSEEI